MTLLNYSKIGLTIDGKQYWFDAEEDRKQREFYKQKEREMGLISLPWNKREDWNKREEQAAEQQKAAEQQNVKFHHIFRESYCYPVTNGLHTLKLNTDQIMAWLDSHYYGFTTYFMGIGTSGAMLITTLLLKANGRDYNGILLNHNESKHRAPVSNPRGFDPTRKNVIVVVDECVGTGQTMDNIAHVVKTFKNELMPYINVVAVPFVEGSRLKMFPNLKHILL